VESQSERLRDYASALERLALDRERQAAPGLSSLDSRRLSRPVVRVAAVACLAAVLIGAGVLLELGGGDRKITAAGRPDALPYIAFLPDLSPGSPPIAAWATPPYVTGLQEYDVAGDGGSTRRFRYVAFSQKLASGGTAIQNVTMVISDAATGDFDQTKLSAGLDCAETVSLRGRDTLIGIDPANEALTFVWREQEGVAIVVSVRGYQRAAAVELLRHLGPIDATWSKTIHGVPAVRNASDPDANWRHFEPFRTGKGEGLGPPVTRPASTGSACP
jgi:hypothetical protein